MTHFCLSLTESRCKQFIDYADLDAGTELNKQGLQELPSHLPQSITLGLVHAKQNDKMISIVGDEEKLDQVVHGDLSPLKEPSETSD